MEINSLAAPLIDNLGETEANYFKNYLSCKSLKSY